MAYVLKSTQSFKRWVSGLQGLTRIQLLSRLARAENGHFGDHKQVAPHLFELRCFFGGGLRVYFTIQHENILFLLAGGDKSSQSRDIERAKTLLSAAENQP